MTTELVIEILISRLDFYEKPISAKWLSNQCYCTERQLRKLIEEIREQDLVKGYVLISSQSGYKLSNDPEEIEAFLNRYLSGAFTMIRVAKTAKKFLSEQQVKGIQTKLDL